eukprot:m51a1_g2116 putative dna replication helicase dna2 (856) ;mRNA; f:1657496-1662110
MQSPAKKRQRLLSFWMDGPQAASQKPATSSPARTPRPTPPPSPLPRAAPATPTGAQRRRIEVIEAKRAQAQAVRAQKDTLSRNLDALNALLNGGSAPAPAPQLFGLDTPVARRQPQLAGGAAGRWSFGEGQATCDSDGAAAQSAGPAAPAARGDGAAGNLDPRCVRIVVSSVAREGEGIARVVGKDVKTGDAVDVVLTGCWADVSIEQGDVAQIVCAPRTKAATAALRKPVSQLGSSAIEVSQSGDNLFILNPDVLVSPTLLGSCFQCTRKTILQEKFKGGETNRHALMGNLAHDVFEDALSSGEFTRQRMTSSIQRVIAKRIPHLWSVGDSDVGAAVALTRMIDPVLKWSSAYFKSGVRPHNVATVVMDPTKERLRRLVVDLEPPKFQSVEASQEESLFKAQSSQTYSQGRGAAVDIRKLNDDQKTVITRVLESQDYTLVLGMPGTGKSTTISLLIQALVLNKKSVLVCSHTHNAVDSVLRKLMTLGVDFVRLARPDQVDPSLAPYTIEGNPGILTVAALEKLLESRKVIGATCLSSKNPVLQKMHFDYCIVDEASQIPQPICFGSLLLADRFVLVGDHQQLPPLVRSDDAKRLGMDVSLFRALSDAHPAAVVELQLQYRMCGDIMLLANELVYSHRLRCDQRVSGQELAMSPEPHSAPLLRALGCPWLLEALDKRRKVVLLDTDGVPGLENRSAESPYNDTEAMIVACLVAGLAECGVFGERIGVITPYRRQIKALRGFVAPVASDTMCPEVHTVDRFQGKDRDCIIVSLVRSNADGNVGDLLRDWRRTNVAFTRARSKLIVVGSARTLCADQMLQKFVQMSQSRMWVVRLPPGAQAVYESLLERLQHRPRPC